MAPLKTYLAVLILGAPTLAQAETFILVHGAFQDASSWAGVAERIEAEGHTVDAVNLPGRDATGEAAKAVSLADYVTTVADAVGAADTPVILVGHSFGGMTISGVAERMPDSVARLVYIAAYVPQSGESMEQLAVGDTDNGTCRRNWCSY